MLQEIEMNEPVVAAASEFDKQIVPILVRQERKLIC
jgi:DNA-directed RNA polymerase subunit K/omega